MYERKWQSLVYNLNHKVSHFPIYICAMKKKIFEVFKAGTHTDANGNTQEWSQQDLELIVEKYNNQPDTDKHLAPVVIGHPEDNLPAYGWVESLKLEGDKVLATLTELQDEFVEWLDKGLYKTRSISLYEDLKLRHIGFLGAVPPAIKGLELNEIKYSEKPMKVFEFANIQVDAELLTKNQLLKVLTQTQDQTKIENNNNPQEGIFMDTKQMLEALLAWASTELGEEVSQKLSAKISELQGQLTQEPAADTTSAAEVQINHSESEETKKLKERVQFLEAKTLFAENKEVVNKLVESGKVLPAQFNEVHDLLNTTEGNSKAKFLKFLENLQPNNLTTQVADGGTKSARTRENEFAEADPEELKAHKEISKISEEKNISYNEAYGIYRKGKA